MSKLGRSLGSKLGPEARSILAAGRGGDDPTPADRARVKRALLRSIAVGAAAAGASTTTTTTAAAQGSLAAAKGTSLGLGLGLKILGGVALAAAVGTGALMERASRPDTVSASAAPSATRVEVEAEAPALQPVSAPSAEEKAESAEPSKARSPSLLSSLLSPPVGGKGAVDRSSRAPVERGLEINNDPDKAPEPTHALAPAEDPLLAETRRLREAHGALRSGDPQKALALLDEQGGQLGEERSAARILALCQLGRVAEAEAARAAFLRDHPRSPLADRIRGGCAPSTPK